MTLKELQQAERAFRKAQQRADQLRQERNILVAQALEQGMTHQQIADATGLSRGRISQLPRETA